MSDLVLYRAGDVVIVVGLDAAAAGERAGQLMADGQRAATFIGDPADDGVQAALQVFAQEQFGSTAEIIKDSNLGEGIR